MEWCTNFCLSCDQQTDGAAYCSQGCRLADLDRVNASSSFEPSSPLSASSHISSSRTSSPTTPSFFHLAPAIDFSTFRSSPVSFSQPPVTAATAARMSLQRSMTSPPGNSSTTTSQLRTSPSGASLASMQSTRSTNRNSLSQQSKNDLFAYANSFDQVRDLKRRKSLY